MDDKRPSLGPLPSGLAAFAQEAAASDRKAALPPVDLWNPPYCGAIPMRIALDGRWFYQGTPIERPALARLFSTLLRRDKDRYVLVTPVECVGIEVEDAPFLAVEMRCGTGEDETRISLRTNFDDWVPIDAAHPLRFETLPDGGLKPYHRVRGDLWALATRSLLYELIDAATVEPFHGQSWFGIRSGDCFFAMAKAEEMEEKP